VLQHVHSPDQATHHRYRTVKQPTHPAKRREHPLTVAATIPATTCAVSTHCRASARCCSMSGPNWLNHFNITARSSNAFHRPEIASTSGSANSSGDDNGPKVASHANSSPPRFSTMVLTPEKLGRCRLISVRGHVLPLLMGVNTRPNCYRVTNPLSHQVQNTW
jgi:hypothetical protein